jgi:surfactin synthase thioesterase subunit
MFLSKNAFADNRAVNLIGYSLGGVVSFNCMKILRRMVETNDPKL